MFVTHKAQNGVVFVRSDILRSQHAFSTRIGGVSDLSHTSALNLAFNRGDKDETVLENLNRFGDAACFEPQNVISLPQIHSSDIIEVDLSMRGEGYFKPPHTACDGYITTQSGIVLGVKTADCLPLIFEAEDENGRIAAVSAVHAGWRGTVAGIAQNAIWALLKKGIKSENIRVALGPCIGECCFEVGEDFLISVKQVRGEEFAKSFVIFKNGKMYADIRAMNVKLLEDCGVLLKNIDISYECTFCSDQKFYSHRRMAGIRGTMLSVVSM